MKWKIPFTGKTLSITKNLHSHGGFSFAMTGSWISRSSKAYVNQGYKLNAHLYSVISRIARIASLAKWQQFDTTGDEDTEMLDTPELEVLNNPNPSQPRKEWIECAVGYKLLLGERTILILSPENGINAGKVQQLHHLPPTMVDIKFDIFGTPTLFKWGLGATSQEIPPENMIYSKYWNPSGGSLVGSMTGHSHRGLSPLEAGRRVLTQSNDVYLAGASLLKNLGAPGMMQLDDDEVTLDQGQLDDAQSRFQEKQGGAINIMRMWFTSVKWKYTKISQSSKEIGIGEAHISTLRDICNIYGTYSQIFNDPGSKAYNNVGEARRDLVMNVVIPELESLAGELSKAMLPKGQEFRVDKSVYPELKKNIKELVDALVPAWWLTPNERRKLMDLGELDDPAMNEILAPTSVMPIGSDGSEEMAKALVRFKKELATMSPEDREKLLNP